MAKTQFIRLPEWQRNRIANSEKNNREAPKARFNRPEYLTHHIRDCHRDLTEIYRTATSELENQLLNSLKGNNADLTSERTNREQIYRELAEIITRRDKAAEVYAVEIAKAAQ